MDFVLIWVDGGDAEWQKEKAKYSGTPVGDAAARFRDWGLLKYWFRGVEKFAPWVDKVHFVTCGHTPEWLNLDHPKINFVKHSEYIPEKYLPTFNSHTIELNLHRIKDLSEEFVYFNDDVFLVSPAKPEDFFRKGLPCDEVDMQFLLPKRYNMSKSIDGHNMGVLNRNFSKKKVVRKHPFLFFNPAYGLKNNLYSFYTMASPVFPGFRRTHTAQSFLKGTFVDVWDKEPQTLDATCACKFRSFFNVNQYLVRYWQIAQGKVAPVNQHSVRQRFDLDVDDADSIARAIHANKYKIICINEDENENLDVFENIQKKLVAAFDEILPEKSSFEK